MEIKKEDKHMKQFRKKVVYWLFALLLPILFFAAPERILASENHPEAGRIITEKCLKPGRIPAEEATEIGPISAEGPTEYSLVSADLSEAPEEEKDFHEETRTLFAIREVAELSEYSLPFCYKGLSVNERALYDALDASARKLLLTDAEAFFIQSVYVLPIEDYGNYGLTFEKARRTTLLFMFENPQYFFLSHSIMYDLTTERITVRVLDEFSNAAARVTATDALVKALSGMQTELEQRIPQGADQFTKEKVIYDYVMEQLTYDYEADQDVSLKTYYQSVYSALIGKKTVCAGYSKLFSMFCTYFGLDSIVVTNDFHAWNMVCVDGQWYYLDVTWDDGNSSYHFFNKSAESIGLNHELSDIYDGLLPAADREFVWPAESDTGEGAEDSGSKDAGTADSGSTDAGTADSGSKDAGAEDGGSKDAGTADSGSKDAGTEDGGSKDAGTADSGGKDAGAEDGGSKDAGTADSGSKDAGTADSGSETGGNDKPGTKDVPDDSGRKPERIGAKFAEYLGFEFYKDKNGDIRCYAINGDLVRDAFRCDGLYTYYLQFDGTAMKSRLTYHPDGVHIIYFDALGHEVFNEFAHVTRSISGDAVDDLCFFNVFGYLYVDVLTYDKSGTVLYYANPYGVLERNGWFYFSDSVVWADGTPCDGIAGKLGCALADASLMTNCYTLDSRGNRVYMQGNGTALY